MTDSMRLTTALVASTLLHLLLAGLVLVWFVFTAAQIKPQRLIEVDLAQIPAPAPKPPPPAARPPAPPAPAAPPAPPPIAIPRSQIVAPSEAGEEKKPADTHLLSDRDNTVDEQKVKRGDKPGRSDVAKHERDVDNVAERPGQIKTGGVAKAPERAAPRASEKKQLAALPRLDQLLPDPGDLAREGIAAQPASKPPSSTQAKVDRDLLGGSGVAFSSRPGITDYLPQIREGDISLLNTKAERFAPFVRRVAARVFQHLSIRLRQAATRGIVGSGRDFAVVEAIMNRQGRLVSARIVEQKVQTNLGADRELLNVTRPETFFDSNPPDGAEASDGNIHFVLMIDLNVQSGVDPRTNRAASGYSGVAGVGLDALAKRN